MSIIVYWGGPHANPNPKLATKATSVVAFRSSDGLVWDFAAVVLDAASAPTSEEGPNENDLALLNDGKTIMSVIRLDAGDGPVSRPYVPYVKVLSRDGGRSWSQAESMGPGVGCARPRLLSLRANGILLSGGRLSPTNRDVMLWYNPTGDGVAWAAYSLSYWHNRLERNASLHFDAKINSSSARESTSYTSLVATGPRSGFIVYARHLPPNPDVAFAMPFTVE